MLRVMLMIAAAAVFLMPTQASAQVAGLGLSGLGGGGQSTFGAPPAGVALHQQYMQLYGLPVNFQQGPVSNGGGQAPPILGLGGYGGGGRFYGVNYRRNMMAAQAAQAAAYRYQNPYGYGMNPYGYSAMGNTVPTANSTGSFGLVPAGVPMPYFANLQAPANDQAATSSEEPKFRGFGLSDYRTANPFLPPTEKKEEKKDGR